MKFLFFALLLIVATLIIVVAIEPPKQKEAQVNMDAIADDTPVVEPDVMKYIVETESTGAQGIEILTVDRCQYIVIRIDNNIALTHKGDCNNSNSH